MSLKASYIGCAAGKLRGGPGGWHCPCCNPYGCHPKGMKKKARRRVRRAERMKVPVAL